MEIKVRQLKGVQFAVRTRTHTVICDQPQDNGGMDQGMTPPEFMLASLGSCAAFYAAQYLRSRGLAEGGVEVTVNAEKLKAPARLGSFRVNVHSPVPLAADQQEAMMRSVQACLIHNTLMTPPQIAIELHVPEHAAA